MDIIFLTKDSGVIIGPIAWILGKIMDGIFNIINLIGLPNVGLAVILFTIVTSLLMLPLTIKQQRFSKLSAKMNPEVQAIQAKYKGKKDNESMMAQNQEIQAVYAKYGVSTAGSCVQLLIQMPILFALYSVIRNVPAYVTKVGDAFKVLADKIIAQDGGAFFLNSGSETLMNNIKMYGKNIGDGVTPSVNGVIDVLNKLSTADMDLLSAKYGLADLSVVQGGTKILGEGGLLDTYNNFLGLNIGNSPQFIISSGVGMALIIGAIMIPVLSALTQWLSFALMPNTNNGNDESALASSMKTMNIVMPIFSAWLCYTMPCGLGIYWIASAVIRTILMIIINKQIDKMDFDEYMAKNAEKSKKKLEKIKKQQEMMNAYASMNTKKIANRANSYNNSSNENNTSTQSTSTPYVEAKPGSMRDKANMVKKYNEKNN